MSLIKSVIFDMDGVLLDAREWHYESLNRALELFGETISRVEHETFFDGLPTKHKLKELSKMGRVNESLHSVISEMKQSFTQEMIIKECRPNFEHEFALSRLKNDGYSLAVASNSITSTIREMMVKAGLIEYLEFFVSNEDVVNAKPDPEIYLQAIRRLELNPEQCLILEDNDHGYEAAIKSGAHVMRVKNPSCVVYENIKTEIGLIENLESKI